MNFLWHHELAKDVTSRLDYEIQEAFCFGSVSPDFVAMGLGRVVRVKPPADRELLTLREQYIQRGIDYHYFIDQQYDDLDSARVLRAVARNEILSKQKPPISRIVSKLMPLLATDLLLDGYLQSTNELAGIELQGTLKSAGARNSVGISSNPPGFSEVLNIFSERIPDYTRPEVVARLIGEISMRRLGRPFVDSDKLYMLRAVQEFAPAVYEAAPQIVFDIQNVAANFEVDTLYKIPTK